MSAHTLSKSDFKLARTCATKLYYRELRYPDRKQDDPYMQLLAKGGYMIELLVKQLFPDGIALEYGHKDATAAAAETMALLARDEVTLFEATLLEGNRLARVDILRKDRAGFDLYEVKSSSFKPDKVAKRIEETGSPFRSLRAPHGISSDYREHLEDVAYQVTVLKDLFPGVPVRPHLILTDKEATAAFDGMPAWFEIVRTDDGRVATARFTGDAAKARAARLTESFDVGAEVEELEIEVREESVRFLASLGPALTRIAPVLGGKCRDCEFRVDDARSGFRECWGTRGDVTPHVLQLYKGGKERQQLIDSGIDSMLDVPGEMIDGLSGKDGGRKRVQIVQTKRGEEWHDPSLGAELRLARHPLHFIDFEAARVAVPHHKGMNPYGLLAFQWSCHTQPAPGAPFEHKEWLNLDPLWPNEAFARSLREGVGDDGTLLVWSHFEKSVLKEIAAELPRFGSRDAELAAWLERAALKPPASGARQLDLLELCRASYFHPAMEGSNSIKKVLDAIWGAFPEVRARFREHTGKEGDPSLGPYAALDPAILDGAEEVVQEGTGAVNAYFKLVYGLERDDTKARRAFSSLLTEYCKLDTLAMVLIWEHWLRITEA